MSKTLDLKNMRVLNTRPAHQAQATSERIALAGGIPVELPLLAIEPTDPKWLAHMPPLKTVQHIIFVSPNAVSYFFKTHPQKNWPEFITTYAIGEGTRNTLKAHGITNSIVPDQPDSEHLLMLARLQEVTHQTILLIKGQKGRTLIQSTLAKRQAKVIPLAVYHRALPNVAQSQLDALWHEDAVDIILITSKTALQHLFMLFDKKARPWLCSKPCLVQSKRLARAAYDEGFKTVITSPKGF